MKLVVDSSAFAKRYVQEEGSEDIDLFLQRAADLALCIILVPEIISGLNRRLREGSLSKRDYLKAKTQLLEDVHDATVHSVKLLEHNVIRAMDAFHVACALEWPADLFVTSDKRQLIAAKNAGLLTEFIGQPAN